MLVVDADETVAEFLVVAQWADFENTIVPLQRSTLADAAAVAAVAAVVDQSLFAQ
jgi:hypothetical protein